MRIVKYIFDFYIESSLHVALAVFALIRITFLKLNISYDDNVAYFGFFGTVVGYNFIKYDELARIKKIKFTKTFSAIIGLSFLSALAGFYYFIALKTHTQFIGFIALILVILYTVSFFPNQQNMRNRGGLKIYLVAIVWVLVTVLLPVINAEFDFSKIVILKCMQQFFLVFVLMLIFEIIDLQFDDLKLLTIPQKYGVKHTKKLSYFFSFIFLALEFFKPNITKHQLIITFLVALILVFFTLFVNAKRTKYYSSFWVESVPLFWLILLMIFG